MRLVKQQHGSAGILTCSSITYAFRPRLRIDSPPADCHCGGNLGFTVDGVFARLFATHASILSSVSSTVPFGTTSSDTECSSTPQYAFAYRSRIFGTRFEPRYIFGAQ